LGVGTIVFDNGESVEGLLEMVACMGWQGSWGLRETSCGLVDIFMEYQMEAAGSSYLVEVVSRDKLL
jgi:hypothetical protein